jgi:hypothetical protein
MQPSIQWVPFPCSLPFSGYLFHAAFHSVGTFSMQHSIQWVPFPCSLLFSRYLCFSLELKRPGRKVDYSLHLAPRLRTKRALPLLRLCVFITCTETLLIEITPSVFGSYVLTFQTGLFPPSSRYDIKTAITSKVLTLLTLHGIQDECFTSYFSLY